MKKVCVLGLGYIGLPTAAILANKGYQVHGVDIIESTVETINRGEVHIVEPDLDNFVRAAVNSGNLKASTSPAPADIFIITVPTPCNKHNDPNLKYVKEALKSISKHLKPNNLILLESTSPVGTTNWAMEYLSEHIDMSNIYLAYCPERVLPGKIVVELLQNNRVIGGITPEATEVAAEFYQTFVNGEVIKTNAKTAEMTKLAENSYRDVNIAFANEISMLCSDFDIDSSELISLTNLHPRVNILTPGCGVGGHCIAVDPWFLIHSNPEKANLLRQARRVNRYKPNWCIEQILIARGSFYKQYGKEPLVYCLGASFKPDIDDTRESPALYIINKLIQLGLKVKVVDPFVSSTSSSLPFADISEAVESSDILCALVKHTTFLQYNFDGKDLLDFCGLTKGLATQTRALV